METKKVAIVGYNRIPFARMNTAYVDQGNQDLLLAALNGLIERYHLKGKLLGEVAGGAVIKHISESNLIRETVMNTSLDPATPACDLQQACDTGIEAAIYIGNKIALGQIESGIACGVEAMSNIPFESSSTLRKALLKANKEKSTFGKLKHLLSPALKDWMPIPYKGQEPKTGLVMGEHTEITAKYYTISREEQDELAFKSHQNMAKAYDEGFFDDMITSAFGLDKDNNLRRDTSLEKLSQLKPAFDKQSGTLTAGNSTPFTDGASAVLLASEEWAKANNLPVLAYITFSEIAGIEYVENKQNLLLAPVFAAERMLRKAGMNLEDFDYYEIHEAFAAQTLATIKIWENDDLAKKFGLEKALGKIDINKLNVKGGSLAAAHPFAATGGRIIATLAKLLNEKGSGKGFISICAARGQGVTMILEK
ncbi:acetyl-CoA C-acetyltransferase [Chryseobacterium indologenes]|uniref:acetyl-CoA C-acetyltransferase n=1 Tax=Chryseobacterium indologenes TaxID=253 RepID=UPI000F50E769|nr:acetyl-CoA C-acetyltransferase [Chryseobacterium indologenes]AYZ37630.1 acetyl-CoA C-acetyltransferase [Chryseobacterium indologenes]MBF6646514.1 acetyl-CoA C-acetyltransferase [Chryseobacterium indologenes]MBU3046875.1 acetyl-CoA C-acetyltransferase [Chryseobacterium indologenes]MEB4762012.1 acetyl-CoA C-acetyltransferase [Chryseobacterium indologenes]QQQ69821.1 acetyl-CoA C-acetyltransferase [Chryseobacterium indologenes]